MAIGERAYICSLKPLFRRLPDLQLSGRGANKAITISSVRWVMAGYNVTDDTARY
jgi:hypothetical protein